MRRLERVPAHLQLVGSVVQHFHAPVDQSRPAARASAQRLPPAIGRHRRRACAHPTTNVLLSLVRCQASTPECYAKTTTRSSRPLTVGQSAQRLAAYRIGGVRFRTVARHWRS